MSLQFDGTYFHSRLITVCQQSSLISFGLLSSLVSPPTLIHFLTCSSFPPKTTNAYTHALSKQCRGLLFFFPFWEVGVLHLLVCFWFADHHIPFRCRYMHVKKMYNKTMLISRSMTKMHVTAINLNKGSKMPQHERRLRLKEKLDHRLQAGASQDGSHDTHILLAYLDLLCFRNPRYEQYRKCDGSSRHP